MTDNAFHNARIQNTQNFNLMLQLMSESGRNIEDFLNEDQLWKISITDDTVGKCFLNL